MLKLDRMDPSSIPATTQPRVDIPETPLIIGMVGGPGSGKGTQCQMLQQTFNLEHISIGDVLREEMNRSKSLYANIIRENMMNGRVGPKEITVAILKDHIVERVTQGTHAFILDGFPRSKDQADYFEHLIGPIAFLIVLDCPERVLIERLVRFNRSRFDDNLENIKRRIKTFQNQTSEVIGSFRSRDKVRVVDSDQSIDEVGREVEARLEGFVGRRVEA